MITLNTTKGKIKISKNFLSIILQLSTTSLILSGCGYVNQTTKTDLEIKKISYTKEEIDEMPSSKEYRTKSQFGNSKIVINTYDANKGINYDYRELCQIDNVRIKIKDEDGNIVDIFTTEQNKDYTVKHLTPGKYTLEITDVPEGYKKDGKKYNFIVENTLEINTTVNYIEIPLEKIENKKLVKTK